VPHFTLNLDPGGPIVNAFVQVSEGRRAALQKEGKVVPEGKAIRALIDTGASLTSIEPSVLQQLGLTPTGTIDIVTPSTGQDVHIAETYDVDFSIYAGVNDPPLSMANLRVAACELYLKQGIHGLIGRDILSRCIFIYQGDAAIFSLAF
jgi:hypothetical protein